MYLLYIVFPIITSVFTIGKLIQDLPGSFQSDNPHYNQNVKIMALSCVIIAVFSTGVYLVFMAYREFKSIKMGYLHESTSDRFGGAP
jgi:hypothetical protein